MDVKGRRLTNDSQTVVWRWDSDAFGATLADGDGVVVTVNLRFPGQYYDAETGFIITTTARMTPQPGGIWNPILSGYSEV